MKRIIYIFTITIASLLFYFSYNVTNYQIYFKTKEYVTYIDDKPLNYLEINNSEDNNKILHRLLTLAKTRNTTIAYSKSNINSDEKNINQLFIYTPYTLKTPLYLKDKNKIIDFSIDDYNKFYTSYYLEKNAYNYLTSFNDSYFNISEKKTYIYPFCQSLNNDNLSLMAIYIYSDDIESFKHQLIQSCQDINISLNLTDNSENFHRADDNLMIKDDVNRLFYAFIICLIAYIVAYCILITKDNKKICIYMLNGYNKITVTIKLYLPVLINTLLIFIFTLITLTLVFSDINNDIYKLLYQRLINYISYFIIFIPIALLCILLYIHFSCNYLNLKNNNYLSKVLYSNYIIKIVIGLILLQPFCSIVNSSMPIIKNYKMMKKYQNIINNNQMIQGNLYFCDQELLDCFMEAGYFCDFETYKVYSDLNNTLLYDNRGNFESDRYMKHSFIMTNKNYLNVFDYQLKDINGNIVNVDELVNNTFLVPKKYQYTDLQPYLAGLMTTPEIIYVENTGSYFDFVITENMGLFDNPIIRVLDVFNVDYINNSNFLLIVNEKYTDRYYHDLLNKYNLENEITFVKTETYYQYYLQLIKDSLFNMIGLICLFSFVFGLFLYQSIYTYFIKNSKKLAVEYLLGINRFSRCQEILMQNICIYFTVCIISLFALNNTLKDTLQFVIFFILIELIIQLLLFIYNEKHKLANALKGE